MSVERLTTTSSMSVGIRRVRGPEEQLTVTSEVTAKVIKASE
jgi:hypothetical protein